MESETIELPKQLMDNVRELIKKTNLFKDEVDFITVSVVKQITKFKDI